MKFTIFAAVLAAITTVSALPTRRHTLNEVCFDVTAHTAPFDADAREIPLGRDFEYGEFCFDTRFKTLRNAKQQTCAMEAPDYRLECRESLNSTTTTTTKFDINYPTVGGPPYLTYDNAPGVFYACPADSEGNDYTFDVFSAFAPFVSVCLPITLSLEPVEASSCSGDMSSLGNTTSSPGVMSSKTMASSTVAGSIMPSSTTLRSTRTISTTPATTAPTTTEPITSEDGLPSGSLGRTNAITSTAVPTTTDTDIDAGEVELTTEAAAAMTTTSSTSRRTSLRRPVPTATGGSFTSFGNNTFTAVINSTTVPVVSSFSTTVTSIPPLLFVPTTTTPEAGATSGTTSEDPTNTGPILTQACRVPTSAPSIAPWRITSSRPGSNPTFGNSAEVAITDTNSTVLEYVIPAGFGMPADDTSDADNNSSSSSGAPLTSTGVCALQFRLPFCSDLPTGGYPCYGFSGTTHEVRNDAGFVLELLHNGGGISWDNQALHQVFPGKRTILGTFDCADIGGGEVGDRTMSWLASSTNGFELEYLQAGVGDDAQFQNGVGAWIVACQ